ncbi:hypothetical protein [Synechocystis sp. PCC 7509]|nr:hypothetical protein [Synechocystis sp. PCC 7509]
MSQPTKDFYKNSNLFSSKIVLAIAFHETNVSSAYKKVFSAD